MVADTYAKESDSGSSTTRGTENSLDIRSEAGSYTRIPYLKFSVNGISGTIQSAILKVYSEDEDDTVKAFAVSDTSWTEAALNYDNRPALGAEIGSGTATVASWFDIDITGYITADGTYSIALDEQADDTRHKLGSREGGNAAYLEITYASAPANNPPVFTIDPISKLDAAAGEAYSDTISGSATDADSDPLSYSIISTPGWLNLATNGVLTGTPAESDAGTTNSWTVEVDDGDGGTDTATLKICVVGYYDTWASVEGLNAGNKDWLLNPDGDDLNNLLEYALGGSPTNGLEIPSITPTGEMVNVGSNVVDYVYRRRTDAAARGLDYTLEVATNLLAGSWSTNFHMEVATAPLEVGFESVTNRVDTVPDSRFIRLRIEQSE